MYGFTGWRLIGLAWLLNAILATFTTALIVLEIHWFL